MPRKPATTKEAIVNAAFELVRKEGLDALTARALAAALGCSTQPIMYQFPNLQDLRELVYQRADELHTQYILAGEDLLGIGMRYIQFAAEEPSLFKLLFQSGHFDGIGLQDLIQAPEAAPLLEVAGLALDGDRSVVAKHFEALYVAVHGYASLVANNAMTYDPEAAKQTLIAIAEGLLQNGGQG